MDLPINKNLFRILSCVRREGPGLSRGVTRVGEEEGYSAVGFLTMMAMVYVSMLGVVVSYFMEKVRVSKRKIPPCIGPFIFLPYIIAH